MDSETQLRSHPTARPYDKSRAPAIHVYPGQVRNDRAPWKPRHFSLASQGSCGVDLKAAKAAEEGRPRQRNRSRMREAINRDRRRFFGTAAMAIAATQFGTTTLAQVDAYKAADAARRQAGDKCIVRLAETDRCRTFECGLCRSGPIDGPPVVLLHGWPYDIHTYVDVTPLLASAGYRVIVPYLRGYGTTRFLSMRRSAMASPRRSLSMPSH